MAHQVHGAEEECSRELLATRFPELLQQVREQELRAVFSPD